MKDISSDEVGKMTPIIVDLGKIGNSKVKELKKGQGVFLEEVLPAVDQVKASLGQPPTDPALPFVVVIYERKSKKLKGLFPLFPG